MKTQNKDEQFWKQFEAEDRRRYPAQWAIHDNMMNQAEQKGRAHGHFIMVVGVLVLIIMFTISAIAVFV